MAVVKISLYNWPLRVAQARSLRPGGRWQSLNFLFDSGSFREPQGLTTLNEGS